ncbi:MAG: class I SAM-dependent methyltransferase, partial [Gammaproteobacteria bacterium]|nr:class I SAM-dependent methyltransferase [Gammaproteobacteria bacterium]
MTEQAFIEGRFTAPRDRRERMTAALLRHLPPDSAARILDLGCGGGQQLLDLAAVYTRAELVGIDTSRANVDSARRAVADRGAEARIAVEERDYLAYAGGPFDAVVSDSVLQNIPGADDRLYAKLAEDIRPGGLLVASIPYGCVFNRVLWLGRRTLRLVR